jgi:hypothetical protein
VALLFLLLLNYSEVDDKVFFTRTCVTVRTDDIKKLIMLAECFPDQSRTVKL